MPYAARDCAVCEHPAILGQKFCARCTLLIKDKERTAHIAALRAGYDKETDTFRCFYTHIVLELVNNHDPHYLVYDHRLPGKEGDLVICARWVNGMKTDLTDEQFRAIIIQLAKVFKGGKFDEKVILGCKSWARAAPPVPRLAASARQPPSRAPGPFCVVCEAMKTSKNANSKYCAVCGRFLLHTHEELERQKAMQKGWNKALRAFICYYSGLKLTTTNNKDALFMVLDHKIPHEKGNMVVCANLINRMKEDLSEEEFRKVVLELARHFETGAPFDRNIIEFKYWNRPKMARMAKK